MKNVWWLVIFLFFTKISFAQNSFTPDSVQLEFKVTRINSMLSIDGRLSEEEWSQAMGSGGFVQLEPQQGKPSRYKTVVKGMYNKKNLYIGFFCFSGNEPEKIRVPDLKRDFAYKQHDMVAVCFDGFNDKRNSMTFACNAYGAQKDYLAYDDVFFDSDWNGLWKVRTTQTDSGWYAEFEIPWKTLRYDETTNGEYKFNINFLRVK
ncbi:MAG TPA: carbohydrate binding family 9 domain-containing protein, partial [Bacillota bacterium]|nr:carbohydrate binding family 9 domain-containing protein [Bacillota bacterium]